MPRLPLPVRQPARALVVVVAYVGLTLLALLVGHRAAGSLGLFYGGTAACAGLLAVALLAPVPRERTGPSEARPVLRRG